MEIISGLLAIWAACAFWAVMFAEIARDNSGLSIFRFYFADVWIMSAFVVISPAGLFWFMREIHRGSK